MRRRFLILLATLALGLGLQAPAHAYDLATNGSFESGNLSGWQVYVDLPFGGSADWFVTDQLSAPISGSPLDPSTDGFYQAATDEGAQSTMILYRDFAIPATLKATLKLTYWINNTGGGYTDAGDLYAGGPSNQKVRIDLQNPAAYALLDQNGILENYFRTNGFTPLHNTATTITRDLTAYAGFTVRLRIAVVVTDAVMNVGVDDVSLEVSAFEPLITTLDGGHHGDAAWGDFDNDNDLDLAIGGATNDANLNVVYRHNGDGTMSIVQLGLPFLQKNSYAWGDYDNDGDLDLSMLGYGFSSQSEIYRNDGGITLTPIGASLWNLSDGAVAWGDYDNDGDLDLIITGWDGAVTSYCVLYRNDGDGSFALVPVPVNGVRNGSIQWGDFDLDGNLDLLTCGLEVHLFSSSRWTQVWRGDGAGNFTLLASGLPAVDDGMARWADFNGDGYLDVALAGETGTGPLARVYTYDPGFGTYSTFIALTAVRGASLNWGDFDNDGDADLALSGTTGSVRSTSVYRNDGGTALVDIGAALPGVQDGVLLWADYDGDLDLDLLVSGDTGAGFISRVYRNSTPVSNAAPSPPTFFASYVYDAGVLFASDNPTDDHTLAPTINLRIGSSANGIDAISPMANVGTGYRRVVQPGNVPNGASPFVKFSGLGHGTVHWAFQGIDGSFIGGPFSAEQTLALGADVLSITDVPVDQGGRVRLTIARSQLDNATRTQFAISGYNVWRRVGAGSVASLIANQGTPVDAARATRILRDVERPATAEGDAPAAVASTDLTDLPLIEWSGRRFAPGATPAFASPFPPGIWELVGSFFSQQQAQYLYNSPTAADSGVGGANWSAFIVTAHTTVPSVWFASEPDSGKSVDNLAPGAPQGLVAQYHTGSGNALNWLPAPEPDFQNFHVYRGSSAAFVPGPGNLVATVPVPSFTDPAFDDATVFYKVSTTDHSGNESARVAPGQTLATEDPAIPLRFALRGAAPNPFGASTDIGFALPRGERVVLRIYDTTGRLVRTLVDGDLGPGDHEVRWSGKDDAGHRLGAGVYFLRMSASSFQATKRLVRVE